MRCDSGTQTLRNATSLEEAGETLTARIQSMDPANDLLVSEGWESAAIHDLIDRALAPFRSVDGPAVVRPTRLGFGSKLIERVLASEVDGTVELDYRPAGVVFTAVAALPEIDREDPAT